MTLSDNMNLNELNITASMYLKSEAQSSFFLIYSMFVVVLFYLFIVLSF